MAKKNNTKKRTPLAVEANSALRNHTGGWRTFRPIIDLNKCIGCSLCSKCCPDNAILMKENPTKNNKKEPVVNYDYCKGCGLCAAECPVKAIIMEKEDK
ncbi:MAG: 4Fe-4S binding protein [Planctomycetes bacterium]|jgi:2-oxoacid:acceptor oxidoreductase delta subunit (pyruvate/2-ketoisovalerate family)|nr:4Fe-4S binding protein [Planctomycetota bacterium]